MALQNRIDPDTAPEELARWLRARRPDAEEVVVDRVVVPKANGLSSESVVFDATWQEAGARHHRGLVARIAPEGAGIYPTYDYPLEARVMRALGPTPVPVPTVASADEDELFGSPAIVMERVPGRVPPDDPPYPVAGWVLDLAPDEQARLVDEMVRTMAQVHAVDWRAVGLQELAPSGESALDREFRYWESFYDWAGDGLRSPLIDAGLEWARAHRPEEEASPVLCWGDARLGNVLYDDALSVVGALDWEMATIGPAALDLGWFLFQLRHHSTGFGVPLPPGFPSEDAIIARYEELTGAPVRDFAFYRIWTGVRCSIMMLRIARRMIELGAVPPDAELPINNVSSSLLAEDLGIPVPAFSAAGWLDGSR